MANKRRAYQEGVYQSGKFMPYDRSGEYRARLNTNSDSKAYSAADHGQVLHGSFKDGVFRPADVRGKFSYMRKLSKQVEGQYKFDFSGEFYDPSGRAVGRLDEKGRPQLYPAQAPRQEAHDSGANPNYDLRERLISLLKNKSAPTSSKSAPKDLKEVGITANPQTVRNPGMAHLEDRVAALFALFSVTLGLVLTSNSITGNVISSLAFENSKFLGAGFFIVGILSALYYFRKK